MTTPKQPIDYDLTCWYLNARRIIELVGINSMAPGFQTLASVGEISDNFRAIAAIAALKNAITQWLRDTNPPTLGQLLMHGELCPNILFTHYSNYFCKGATQAR